jgi:hypothetical protein
VVKSKKSVFAIGETLEKAILILFRGKPLWPKNSKVLYNKLYMKFPYIFGVMKKQKMYFLYRAKE